MNILGIHAFIHDSGACLISNGDVRAISEERLDRRKHSAAFPSKSIRYLLDIFGIRSINEIDLAVCDMFEREGEETIKGIRSEGYTGRIELIRHHDAHAASAYFASQFNDAAVLVVDGAGSSGSEYPPGVPPHFLAEQLGWMQEVQSFYHGAGNSLDLIRRTFATPDRALGIGFLYGVSCEYLGFDKLDGGKLMGLAAYGRPNPKLKKNIFMDSDGDILIPLPRSLIEHGDIKQLRNRLYGGLAPRSPGKKIADAHEDIAYWVQDQTERAMLSLARRIRIITGSRNICLAGGVALNGLANTNILESAGFENIFIPPASNDYGIPLGCALYGAHLIHGSKKRYRMNHAFLGRDYPESEIHDAVSNAPAGGLSINRPSNIAAAAAGAIAEGKIIGLFHGPSEFGPRALGNRSILADPRRPDMKDLINRKVKHREPFRPYAPAVLSEHAAEFFEPAAKSPFMLLIARVKKHKQRLIPAAIHADGTARLQTVERKAASRLHSIITEFYSITGIPMVINTSMNLAGDPIVETPAEAVRLLIETGLDALICGEFFVEKNSRLSH